jgi:hypothetical protein
MLDRGSETPKAAHVQTTPSPQKQNKSNQKTKNNNIIAAD